MLALIGVLCGGVAFAQTPSPADAPYEACILAFGYTGCQEMGRPGGGGPPTTVIVHFAAVAISPSTMAAGQAHGQNSLDEAKATALQRCRSGGAQDCRVLTWGQNHCVSLAVSHTDKHFGYGVGDDRNAAAAKALSECGKNCFVLTAPCAGDAALWASPLPLPTGVRGGPVDPAMVGTWVLDINPGRWIWRVAANGTYEFHSEAIDQAGANAGTLTSAGGHYTLHAITTAWDDVGTYVVQSPGVIVATGKLGTGTWKKLTQ